MTWIVISVSSSTWTKDNFRGKSTRDISCYVFPRFAPHVVPVEISIAVPATVPSALPITASIPSGHSNWPKGWVVDPNTTNLIPTKRSNIWTLGENNQLDHKLCGHRLSRAIFLTPCRKASQCKPTHRRKQSLKLERERGIEKTARVLVTSLASLGPAVSDTVPCPVFSMIWINTFPFFLSSLS